MRTLIRFFARLFHRGPDYNLWGDDSTTNNTYSGEHMTFHSTLTWGKKT